MARPATNACFSENERRTGTHKFIAYKFLHEITRESLSLLLADKQEAMELSSGKPYIISTKEKNSTVLDDSNPINGDDGQLATVELLPDNTQKARVVFPLSLPNLPCLYITVDDPSGRRRPLDYPKC